MRTAGTPEFAAFMAVAKHRNFRKAADERGVTAAALSHAIRRLETQVGIRLVQRTTRSVSLTDAGQMFYARLLAAFGEIDDALEALNDYRQTPVGTVKLNAPSSLAAFVLGPVLTPLVKRNPGLRIEVVTTDRLIDIVSAGFDAGIRFGERLSQDVIAVRVKAQPRLVVIGSPAYFSAHPVPQTPQDLNDHVCIRYAFPSGKIFNWEFRRGNETTLVEANGPLTVDDQELLVDAALGGAGIAFAWEHRVLPHLQSNRLIRCLDDWCPREDSLFLYYPSHRNVSAGLRAVIDAIKA
jgi:DNA-binding transcriptional LysR family regulator